MTTKEIICNYNRDLKQDLIPDSNEPIYAHGLVLYTDPNDEIFLQPLIKENV